MHLRAHSDDSDSTGASIREACAGTPDHRRLIQMARDFVKGLRRLTYQPDHVKIGGRRIEVEHPRLRSSDGKEIQVPARNALKEPTERGIETRQLAILIDAIHLGKSVVLAAVRLDENGNNQEGATENSTAVGSLLGLIVDRGLDPEVFPSWLSSMERRRSQSRWQTALAKIMFSDAGFTRFVTYSNNFHWLSGVTSKPRRALRTGCLMNKFLTPV